MDTRSWPEVADSSGADAVLAALNGREEDLGPAGPASAGRPARSRDGHRALEESAAGTPGPGRTIVPSTRGRRRPADRSAPEAPAPAPRTRPDPVRETAPAAPPRPREYRPVSTEALRPQAYAPAASDHVFPRPTGDGTDALLTDALDAALAEADLADPSDIGDLPDDPLADLVAAGAPVPTRGVPPRGGPPRGVPPRALRRDVAVAVPPDTAERRSGSRGVPAESGSFLGRLRGRRRPRPAEAEYGSPQDDYATDDGYADEDDGYADEDAETADFESGGDGPDTDGAHFDTAEYEAGLLRQTGWAGDGTTPVNAGTSGSPTFPEVPATSYVDGLNDDDRDLLVALGVPPEWVDELGMGDRFSEVVAMFSELPVVDIDVDTELVAVIGPGGVVELEAHRTALDLPVGWAPRPVHVVRARKGQSRRAVLSMRKHGPVVVAVEVDGYGDLSATMRLLEDLDPDAVIAVVDASAPLSHTRRWLEGLPRVDAVAVDGALEADQPAAVLSLDLPVVRLDGIAIDSIGWTALMCASLSAHADAQA